MPAGGLLQKRSEFVGGKRVMVFHLDPEGASPLALAAMGGHTAVAALLLRYLLLGRTRHITLLPRRRCKRPTLQTPDIGRTRHITLLPTHKHVFAFLLPCARVCMHTLSLAVYYLTRPYLAP